MAADSSKLLINSQLFNINPITDTYLLQRSGTSIQGLNPSTFQAISQKGIINGYASLDSSGLVPTTQMPTISITGDATGSGLLASIPITLANTAVTPGSYTNSNITVDSKGRITSASSNPSPTILNYSGQASLFTPYTVDIPFIGLSPSQLLLINAVGNVIDNVTPFTYTGKGACYTWSLYGRADYPVSNPAVILGQSITKIAETTGESLPDPSASIQLVGPNYVIRLSFPSTVSYFINWTIQIQLIIST